MRSVFYVYMVADRSRVLYVGFTSDLEVRVKREHREGRFEGFTWRYGCDRLVWFERYGSAIDGISREKTGSRGGGERKDYVVDWLIRHGRIIHNKAENGEEGKRLCLYV